MAQLRNHELLLAMAALKAVQSASNFPINFSPVEVVFQKKDEFVDVPKPVSHMLGNHVPMEVNEYFSLWTCHPLPLLHRKDLIAVGAQLQNVPFFFKQSLQLFRIKLRHQLVLSIFNQI